MSYEHKPGTFTLFRNDKRGNDKRPDYRGTGKDMDGNDIEVAAWERKGGRGPFLSCTIKPKEQQQKPAKPEGKPFAEGAEDLDDLPFAPIGRGIGGHAI